MSNLSIEELEKLLEQKKAAAVNNIVFPDTTTKGIVKSTLANAETLMAHYGISIRHNEMSKELEIEIPGIDLHPDTAINAARGYIRS